MAHPLLAVDPPVSLSTLIFTSVLTFLGGGGLWAFIQNRLARRDTQSDARIEDSAKVRIAQLEIQHELTESEQKIRHNLRNEFQGIILKMETRLDAVERERDIFKWAYCQLYYAARAIQGQSKAAHEFLREKFPEDPRWKVNEVPLDGMTPETLIGRANPAVTVNVAVPPGDPRKTSARIEIKPGVANSSS